jgi:SAM-dependent methyltransferase
MPGLTTKELFYTKYLIEKTGVWWKHFFNVQAPFQWNLRRLKPGLTLDIGCGIGRYLIALKGNGVGIDHNLHSVQFARKRGLTVFTPDKFQASLYNVPGRFDSILLSHVLEHMGQGEARELITRYMPLLKPKGKLIIIVPQEAGYKSDSTHVEFMDFAKLQNIITQIGFTILEEYSFPFPRSFAHLLTFNEFISVSHKP